MELTKQSSGLLCKLVIYYYIFVIYYYILHDRSNASIAGDRDLRSPAIDALLSVAPAHPARNLDMHLCWHVHPSNVKNLVVDEEKSVLNHQTHIRLPNRGPMPVILDKIQASTDRPWCPRNKLEQGGTSPTGPTPSAHDTCGRVPPDSTGTVNQLYFFTWYTWYTFY